MQGATPELTVLPRGQPSHTMNRLNVLVGQGMPRPGASKVSGMMEVIAPEDGFILETCLPLSRHSSLGRTDAMKEQKNKHNGRLHVFGPEEEVVIEPIQTVPRMGCGNEPTSRPYTPSKQILLCTAKSLEKRNALAARIVKKKNPKMNVRPHDCLENADEKMKNSKIDEKTVNNEVCTEPQKDSVDKKKGDEKPPDSSDDENNTRQTDNETQKRIAPLQLMGEFLKAIMERKYNLAKKLCQMILIYEPSNPEAKQFLPLIEKKLLLESHCADEDEETDEEGSDETEEETNSSESSETESETSSEDSQDS
ncbi:LOW QUALITY PROTEIN: glutamate-rich protein 2 [Pantherophis guttatus]|uniref:LOW QUALITY PROTEIN: glutamate-rich protein 2 n=1 Tax=Pantherophis guttatus TaxID=94885 RepID=A0A6P9CUG6_PANGU|nr:LOW QUALITY PROTEIN: glutamate-rich protein 2 [Pantherophis guttatus]